MFSKFAWEDTYKIVYKGGRGNGINVNVMRGADTRSERLLDKN